jgi:hypothetical protein
VPKHASASWLLCSLLPRAHAESVLGDLLEIAGDDQAKFQKLLFDSVWELLRRSIAGFLLAVTVGGGGVLYMQFAFFASLTLHTATHSQRAWGSTLAFLAGCFLVMACFSVARYGFRDRMTCLALAFIPLLAASALLWWVPGAPVAANALLLLLMLGSLLYPTGRSAFLVLALIIVMQSVLWFGAVGMILKPLSGLLRHLPANAIGVKPFISAAFGLSYAALVMLTCLMYAKVRRWTHV